MSDTFDHEADAWDSLNDGDDGSTWRHYPKTVKCKKCGEAGLHWKQHPSGKWWMTKWSRETLKGEWHTCKL